MARKTKRQLAALKAWATKRTQTRKRSLAAKKGWKTRAEKAKRVRTRVRGRTERRPSSGHVSYLVSIDLKPTRGKSYGKRDFVVPAQRGASFSALRKIAEETLTGPERQLLQFFKKENVTISEGPKTRAKKAVLR